MSSALRLLGPNMLSKRWIDPKPEQMKSDPASSVGRVRAVRRISDSLIRASLPEHDSRLRSITIRFSAASERTPLGYRRRDGRRVDAAVLHALRADRAGKGHAARLEVEHRVALGAAHQRLGPAAGGDPHLHPARGVRRCQQRLRPRGVVAVHEDLVGAVERDRLGVRHEARACRARARAPPRPSTARARRRPPRPDPSVTARALEGASLSTGTVVSSSRNPKAAAVAASAASSSGSSRRLVTCAWLLGVRRARTLVIAIISSTGRSIASGAASLAGVIPPARRTSSSRGTAGSTSIRA